MFLNVVAEYRTSKKFINFIFLLTLLISTFIIFLCFIPHKAYAATADSDFQVNVDSVLELALSTCDSVDNSQVVVNIEPTTAGTFKSNCQYARVFTNLPGYTLSAKASTTTMNYQNPTTITPTPTIASTSNLMLSPSTLANDTWGFAVENRLGFQSSYTKNDANNLYAGLPTTETTIYATNAYPLPETEHLFYYAARLTPATVSGSYATTITYTAIGNEPAPVLTGITITGSYAQNGTPTPDNPVLVEVVEEDVGLNVAGQNLLYPWRLRPDGYAATVSGVSWLLNSDGSITANGTATLTNGVTLASSILTSADALILPKDTTVTLGFFGSSSTHYYYISMKGIESGTSYDSIMSYSSAEARTFTTTEAMYLGYATRVVNGQTANNLTFYPTLTIGNTEAEFTIPTLSSSATIDLQGNFLGALPNGVADTIDIDMKGNVVLTKNIAKYTVNSVSYGGENNSLYYFSTRLPALSSGNSQSLQNLLCGDYVVRKQGDNYTSGQIYIANSGQTVYVYPWSQSITTIEDMNTYLLSNPFDIYYQLAEPYTVNLGKISLPAQSSMINVWSSSNPATTVTLNYI